ncbi:hydroxymethylglutaryl-CoA reductase (NADPH) [Haloferula luteola]|uniref:hydroxymethylglutaryl-CoA reductase (NADPH) n=1 Tax=Haloferula luteola TaxID=595692 RepID=A0A840VHL9_9BACT|nr:hydroxymethylglutaryl-CoA reductase [Haloferula luteola]MBB5352241.1 hydroxymethylglutaryl-CoA reductase (NADPH) [Haloferula luteola]
MSGKYSLSKRQIEILMAGRDPEALERKLSANPEASLRLAPASAKVDRDRALKLWRKLGNPEAVREILLGDGDPSIYQGNIENCLGEIRLPLGYAGPLRVRGLSAEGDYIIPLATTEAALVASYHRGCALMSEAGGCTAMVIYESVGRSPAFAFETMALAGRFVAWAVEQVDRFKHIAGGTTRHGELLDMGVNFEGNHVYLTFEFSTGDASGQNMVTLATQAICEMIKRESPVRPERMWVEGNLSGDKKASAKSFTTTRGKKVTAEVRLSAELIEKRLHTTPEEMEHYWRVSAMGGVLSGSFGVQGHFANGLAALYLATGQDVACVAESATGVTRFERKEDDGSLYASVTLPGLMVGTVGGGTGLPTQKACLELMGLAGAGKARALAEVAAGLMLAGELSIIGALAAGHFSRAHQKLARER